jgi:hypothetical protein
MLETEYSRPQSASQTLGQSIACQVKFSRPVSPRANRSSQIVIMGHGNLWISRKFFFKCNLGVTQRKFSSSLVQKENPLSH